MKPGASDRETRSFSLREVRIERRADGKGSRIVGHAAVFDTLSEDLGGFREKIAPGAFSEAIRRDDVRALFNHDNNLVLGRNKAGTLSLAEDSVGLKTVIDLPDTTFAADLAKSMQRGDISQMSFAFSVRTEDQKWEQAGASYIRTILKVSRLWDVSVVASPAYLETDAAVRALADVKGGKTAGARPRTSDERTSKQIRQSIYLWCESRLGDVGPLLDMLDLNDKDDRLLYEQVMRLRLTDV